jgi:uncharacterized damage-inducible protein DinB
MNFPNQSEYQAYFQKYIDLVKPTDFFEQFDNCTQETIDLFSSIDKGLLNHRYAEGKWTIKDVLMHIIDTERGFSYRAIVCVRKDAKTPLYGMDEDFYAQNVDVTNRSIDSLLDEFQTVRKAFRFIFEYSTEDQLAFIGNANGKNISARALGYVSIGHTKHHLNVIRERYLVQ